MGVNGVICCPAARHKYREQKCGLRNGVGLAGVTELWIANNRRWQKQLNNVIYLCVFILPSTRTPISIRPMDSEKLEGKL
jgi:hypothetical protein